MTHNISIYMAFAAGVISFLSPCVLPLVPGYISFISGVSLENLRTNSEVAAAARPKNYAIVINAIFFISGFSIVFVLLGASATWLGAFLSSRMSVLTKAAGVIIILFGLFKMGIIRPLFFYKEAKFDIQQKKFGLVGALLIGAAFAFGWTPCIGPILAGILAYAATLESVSKGVILLFVYAMGLGIPFLLTAIGVNQFFSFFNRIKKYLGILEKAAGAIMIIFGILIYTNKLTLLQGYFPWLNQFAL